MARLTYWFRPISKEKGIDLTVQGEPAPTVEVVSVRIEQPVVNFLNNALRNTPAGGCFTVNVATIGDEVEFTVYNSFPGIPLKELPYIWDCLYRVDASRSRE